MAKKYNVDFLKKISLNLEKLPNNENKDKNLHESIEILKPAIINLIRKGYKIPDICELLRKEGIEANLQYLQKIIQKISKLSKKTKQKLENNIDNKNKKEPNHSKSNDFSVNDDSSDL